METCCSRFMNDFDVVSINMAKNQLLALNIQNAERTVRQADVLSEI